MIPWNQAVAPTSEPLSDAQGRGEVAGFRFSTADNDAPFAAWRAVLATLFEATQTQKIPLAGSRPILLSSISGRSCFAAALRAAGAFFVTIGGSVQTIWTMSLSPRC